MHKKVALYWFALALVTYEFTTYAANDMIMPGMLQVVKQFNAPLEDVALSMSLYILGCSALQLLVGPWAERYGRRGIIIFGNALFLAFTLMLSLAQSIGFFMSMRFVQGMGMAFTAIGYAIIHRNFNDSEALKLTSLMANVAILAPLFGPVIGGVIVSHFSWHFVFIFTGITGLISLVGLIKFAPQEPDVVRIQINPRQILADYWKIIRIPGFFLGVFCSSVVAMPLLFWISLSPTIIMHTAKLNMNHYMLYQVIAMSGLMVSSILMQFIAGRLKLHTLIRYGLGLVVIGIITSSVFYMNLLLVAIGFCFYGLGLGFSNGVIMRIVATLETKTQSMLFSFMVFIQTIIMALCIQLASHILQRFSYGLGSFALINLIPAVLAIFMVLRFAHLNRNRAEK